MCFHSKPLVTKISSCKPAGTGKLRDRVIVNKSWFTVSCILDIKDSMLICTMASISFHSCTFTNHA